ncbi:hypothetical protein FOL47_005330 [Perkinsus chesapeaki]|uniref:DNA polymerase n=1 Tax=Perkinsus chesapeaki TaxID=330153 RepID=A0A7J6LYG7_PERCH|nr:hypothetical protein FOL47_005330 [Perkinsus chesapeaki]
MKRAHEEEHFLDGCRIYIVPLGSLSQTTWRYKILVKRAQEAGADVTRNLVDDSICIACSSVSPIKLKGIFSDVSHLPLLLKAEWLCDSLDGQRKLPYGRYRIELVDGSQTPDPSPTLPSPEGCENEEIEGVSDKINNNDEGNTEDMVEAPVAINCNKQLSQLFRDLEANLRHNKGGLDEFRARSYRRAADKIDKLSFPLDSDAAVDRFESECGTGIGTRIKDKVREFVRTGSVKKAEVVNSAERTIGIRELTNVWGVGVSTAERWYAMGIRNVEALRHSTDVSLNHNQQIGLKYFEEFNSKIPRQEVDDIVTVVRAGIDRATLPKYGGIANFNVEVCGSYRRGKAFCGDVDFLVTHRTIQLTYAENYSILTSIINSLSTEGVSDRFPEAKLTDHLNQYRSFGSSVATVDEEDDDDSDKADAMSDRMSSPTYFGVFHLSPHHIHRRIDIKVWPLREYPYALVHFTGSGVFNRKMRYYAKTKLGLKVNDHGVFRRDGSCIECSTEGEVFDCLKIKYMDPTLRESETALEILETH